MYNPLNWEEPVMVVRVRRFVSLNSIHIKHVFYSVHGFFAVGQFAVKKYISFGYNAVIRERLCQPLVSLKLRRARMKWLGHVERMGDERQVKKILNATMEGRRPVGRPRTRWKDVLGRDLESSGLSLEQAAVESRDRGQ